MKKNKNTDTTKKVGNKKSKIIFYSGLIIVLFGIFLLITRKNTDLKPQSLDIFVVDNTMEYGYTTLVGIIRTDSVNNGEGNYYLVLQDDRLVIIDKTQEKSLKKLVGKNVEISGELVEIQDLGVVGLLLPSSITEK